MDVSSATSVLIQPSPTTITPNSSNEEKVEGTKPDNEGDRNDVTVSSTSAVNTTTDTLGTQINVTA